MFYIRQTLPACLIAVCSGVLITFSLSPFSLWPLSIIAPALLATLLVNVSIKQAFLRSFLFWLGAFASGTSWVYVSIHDFGFTGAPLAIAMTLIFVAFLALVSALPFVLFIRCLKKHSTLSYVFAFPAIWVISEWLRSWLFTGFPWLYSGYAHTDTLLSYWAPLIGVWGLSYMSVLSGLLGLITISCSAHSIRRNHPTYRLTPLSALALLLGLAFIWLTPLALKNIMWTSPIGEPQRVAIIQPNVPLHQKWSPLYHADILSDLDDSAAEHWDVDIQVWPEAAIPSVMHSVTYFIDDISQRAEASRTTVFSGTLYDDLGSQNVYNSLLAFGQGSGIYHKQKLVPFGEYVPFEKQLRGLINFFNLPSSVIRVGPHIKSGLQATANDASLYTVSPFICYEVVYPDFVADHAQQSDLMLTISNDAWFGDSIGPLQHFQMARMRAIENQKYLIRATNTGISAIIDPSGKVLKRTPQFEKTSLRGEILRMQGTTPYSRFGSLPLILGCFFSLLCGMLLSRKKSSPLTQPSED